MYVSFFVLYKLILSSKFKARKFDNLWSRDIPFRFVWKPHLEFLSPIDHSRHLKSRVPPWSFQRNLVTGRCKEHKMKVTGNDEALSVVEQPYSIVRASI